MTRYWLPFKTYLVGKLSYFTNEIPTHEVTARDLLGVGLLREDELFQFVLDLQGLAREGCFGLKAKIPKSYIESEMNKIRGGMVAGTGSSYRKPDPQLGLGSALKKALNDEYLSSEELGNLLVSKNYGAVYHCKFILDNLAPAKSQRLLGGYLELYRGDVLSTGSAESVDGSTAHFTQLLDAVKRLMVNNYKSVIKFTDIWTNEYDRTPKNRRFWEVVLYAKSVGNLDILEMGYHEEYRSATVYDGRTHTFPYPRPYAKVAPSAKMQKYMLSATAPKPTSSNTNQTAINQAEVIVKLKLAGLKLVLEVGGNSYLIKAFSSKGSAQFKACSALLRQNSQPLTKLDAGIGETSSSWADTLKNLNLTGALRENFVQHSKNTVALIRSISMPPTEVAELVKGMSRLP